MLERTIRLYIAEDLPLLVLFLNDKNFAKKVKQIIDDYAKGKVTLYPIDDIPLDVSVVFKEKDVVKYKSSYIHLYFSKKNIDGYKLIGKVPDGYKCDFIKNIIINAIPIDVISDTYVKLSDLGIKLKKNKVNNPKANKNIDIKNNNVSHTKENNYLDKSKATKTELIKETKKETPVSSHVVKQKPKFVIANSSVEEYIEDTESTEENSKEENDIFSMFNNLAQEY